MSEIKHTIMVEYGLSVALGDVLRNFPAIVLMLLLLPAPLAAADVDLYELGLAELMNVEITSVSRKKQNMADAAAAVYVINREDIRDSGASSVPELLRQVPGLNVAQVTSNRWAISARGFNGLFSNKLLVQIDGRSIYSPTFSGVYWANLGLLLEDIERIEVIRGPGATLWGANAVNGIINIITRSAGDSSGGHVSVDVGDDEYRRGAVRYGFDVGTDIQGRISAQYIDFDSSSLYSYGVDAYDGERIKSASIRFDGVGGDNDAWTMQGSVFDGDQQMLVAPYWTEAFLPTVVWDDTESSGGNIMGSWQHNCSDSNSFTLKGYVDYVNRDTIIFDERHYTLDIDFQHQFQLCEGNNIVWGAGFRLIDSNYDSTYMARFSSDDYTNRLYSGFVQDEITLVADKVWLTLGCKVEHNDYTDFEVQPSVRLMWKVAPDHRVWAAVSRAVRTPNRFERSTYLVFKMMDVYPYSKMHVQGSNDFESENVMAYEAGYRYVGNEQFSFDLAAFYNDYDDLRCYRDNGHGAINIVNDIDASGYGFEVSTRWQPLPWMDSEFNYTYLRISTHAKHYPPGDFSVSAIVDEHSSPRHQLALMTHIDLGNSVRLNLAGRYVSGLDVASPTAFYNDVIIQSYYALDANICWQVNDAVAVQISGKNLLDSKHLEFVGEYFIPATEISRSCFARLTWDF